MALTNGLVVMTPTTVDKTGGSSTATINADGSVTFGSCATLSLNGVFTSAYDNYMVVCRNVWTGSGAANLEMRLRATGSDNSTASSYVRQLLFAGSNTVSASRTTADFTRVNAISNTQRNGFSLYLFGPYLAQPTAGRSVTVDSENSAVIYDFAWTHNQSIAYDGLTLYPGSNAMTGLVTVFGFQQ